MTTYSYRYYVDKIWSWDLNLGCLPCPCVASWLQPLCSLNAHFQGCLLTFVMLS